MKSIYFISDAHLGSRAIQHQRTHERRLVNFLDAIKHKAEAVYMLGDMFDFWFEYKEVVPKGFTRFLGKVSELTDLGVEVHYFCGNHDLWCGDYLTKECGVILHKEEYACEIMGKEFFMAHGDGLGLKAKDWKTKMLFTCFHSRTLRRIAQALPSGWFVNMGKEWAKHSRKKRRNGKEIPFRGEEKEELVRFAKSYLTTHPTINYFIFGHRHIQHDMRLDTNSRLVMLGEWISLFTYAVFDGENLYLENFVEGETKL